MKNIEVSVVNSDDRDHLLKITTRAKSGLSDPLLFQIWETLRFEYFPNEKHLEDYIVYWSPRRQRRVLATCNLKKMTVRVAKELKRESCHKWLEPLLFHEMCHAVLNPLHIRRRGRIRWHGREFRALERRHPGIRALDSWISGGGWRALVQESRNC